ncbi:MAG: hypothetical protein ABEI80_04995 [Haloplanus sp.]
MNRDLPTAAIAGSAITAGLFLVPSTYQYAPILGGVVVGLLAGDRRTGAREGAFMGLLLIPLGVVVTAVGVLALPGVETGVDVLVRSMRGMGPRTVVFYVTLVYFLATYAGLAGGLFGSVVGTVVEVSRDGV